MIRVATRMALFLGLALGGPFAFAQQQGSGGGEALRLECGGIGLEESQRMRADAPMHALTLLFATTDGAYLADVATRIDDPLAGHRVEALCGPIGQVDVAEAGRYRISARFGNVTQEHWVDLVPGGGARLTLRWAETIP